MTQSFHAVLTDSVQGPIVSLEKWTSALGPSVDSNDAMVVVVVVVSSK